MSAATPYYFVAHIRMHDPAEYKKYIDQAGLIFSKYKGKYLTVDDHPRVLEGKWNYTRLVIIEFPSKEDFYFWYYSPDYQVILKHRLTAAECDTVLAMGGSR